MQADRLLDEMVERLAGALGPKLASVVLYGPAAHDDHYREISDLNLLVVTTDLEADTLARMADPVRWWLRHAQVWPRLFTRELIRDAVDIYPVELLDISRHHRVLQGDDPFAGVAIDPAALRLQCERELREKLMRLREGYIESRGRTRALSRLLAASFASLAPVWRACLQLLGAEPPAHDRDAAAALCARLGLDRAPFDQVALVAAGGGRADPDLFARYSSGLAATVARIDRLLPQPLAAKGRTP